MIPKYQRLVRVPVQEYTSNVGNVGANLMIAGILAIVNLLIELFVGFLLVSRLMAVMNPGKMVGLDWVIVIGGFLFLLLKIGLAIYCALGSFAIITITDKTMVKYGGIAVLVLNLILLIIYILALVMVGLKDPTSLALYVFLGLIILTLLEIITTAVFVYFLDAFTGVQPTPYSYPNMYATPNRAPMPISYTPVLQYAP